MLNFRLSYFLLLFIITLSAPSFGQFVPSSISPTHITAGTGSILTITGTGFGASKTATSYVAFPKAYSLGFSQVQVADWDYISWSNTKIEVRVPAGAGTGSPMISVSNLSFIYLPSLTITNLPAITSFSPTTIASGTSSLLTINGTGFGSVPGRVDTRWSGENNANAWIGATSIVSWSDTQIIVRVKESVGSGQIAVVINGLWITSPTSLTVKYGVFTSPAGEPIILANTNGNGGYTFQLENVFAANIPANAAFRRALNKWVCATNINWGIGPNTSVNTSGKDGVNVVKFGGSGDIVVGTLAYTAIGYEVCGNGEFELADIDMTFNNRDYNWNYTNALPANNQYDFETVALHELGHAHGLVHVNNAGDPMFHTTSIGSVNRGLSAAAIEGGKYMLTNSQLSTNICYEPITPLPTGTCPPIPTISSFTPSNGRVGNTITLTGSNFTNATQVNFGNMPATSFIVVSSTTITAVVGPGATSGDVSVITPNGIASSTGFTFLTTLPQTLSYIPLPTKIYGDADFDPAVNASSGLPVIYSSSNTNVATIVNNKVHIVGAGSAFIYASQAGNSVYGPESINLNLVVNKADQSINFTTIPGKLTTDPDFNLDAIASSGLAVTYTNSNPSVVRLNNATVSILSAGTTTITAIQNGNSNINAAPSVSITLTVSNLPQILTFNEISSKNVNDPDFDPGATVNTGLFVTYTSSNHNVATIVNNKIHIVGAGSTIITASQEGNLTYAFVSKTNTLIVKKLPQTINFPALSAKTYNDPDFDPAAISNAGLAITYTSSNLNVATIVNGKVHIVGAGISSITATQAGDATYSATSASVNLTVNKLPQTISFPHFAVKVHNDPDFDLNATSSSGLPISYSSSNPAVATILSGKVHIIASGTTTITASQSGNTNISAAADVTQNLDVVFNIPISNFSIKSTDETCKTSNNGSINITATQTLSYTAAVTTKGATTTYPFNSVLTLNNLEAGTYTVCITVAGQPSYKQCFEVNVKEPKDLAVYSSVTKDGDNLLLKLEGSELYRLELNGEMIITRAQEISLPLIKGNNILKISTDKICQGTITRTFLTSKDLYIYPNPVKNVLNITVGTKEPVKIDVHALDGRLVQTSQQIPNYGQLSLDVSKLSKGLYILTLYNGSLKTVHKMIKN